MRASPRSMRTALFAAWMLPLFFTLHGAVYGQDVPAQARHHTIVIEAMQFSPSVLEARVGDSVEWINRDAFPHNATALDQSFQSKEMASGETWMLKLEKPGAFSYLCTLHPTMKASLRVK